MTGTPHTHHWFGCGWFAQAMSTMGGRPGTAIRACPR